MAKLYIVATPIGNLNDVTYRAIETLKNCDLIACEDTRHTLALLNRYEIKKPLYSYYKQKEKEGSVYIADAVESGKNVALVSDAGMPCVSDPGSVVVKEFLSRGLEYTVIPGASAVVCAAALAGVEGPFTFLGFLPEKNKDRTDLLSRHKDTGATLIVYSAPHDINKIAQILYENLGERKAFFVKEISKIYEKVREGNLSEMREEDPKGEYVIVVEPAKNDAEATDEDIKIALKDKINKGMDKKAAVLEISTELKVPKNRVYKLSVEK